MKINANIKEHLNALVQIQAHPNPWYWSVISTIAICFPICVGVYFGQLKLGMLSSFGSMIVVNLPSKGSFFYRMSFLLSCSFGLLCCFAIGLIVQHVAWLTIPIIFFVSFWVILFGRYYQLTPPAGLFVMSATAIAMFIPTSLSQIPTLVGVVALGSMSAGVFSCVYTLFQLFFKPDVSKPIPMYREDIFIDSLLLAFFLTSSLAIAMLLNMPRPYWAMISCFVILLGVDFYSMWLRQFQRIIGTAIGLVLASWLVTIDLTPWGVVLMTFILLILIDSFIIRNYAIASIFIAPLTIISAEYSGAVATNMPIEVIMSIRFWDTVLGCGVGLIGGAIIHSKWLRPKVRRWEIRLLPFLGKRIIPPVEGENSPIPNETVGK